MKTVLLACVAMAWVCHALPYRPRDGLVGAPPRPEGFKAPPEQYLKQPVDHFNSSDTRTFDHLFIVNDTFFNGDGPVFLMINGESPLDPVWAVEGSWLDNGRRFGALCVLVEHRFYGKSQPFDDLSTEHLRYLSSEQALADLAGIHDHIMTTYKLPETTKWITFGGSYSGALSAWARTKYPSLYHGAIANSAPVLATLDFVQYYEVVTASLQTSKAGTQCTDNIQTAITALQDLVKVNPAAAASYFGACGAPQSSMDVANFMSTVGGSFMGVVQYNKDNRAFEGATNTNITIDVVCDMMVSGDNATEALRSVSNMMNNPGGECFDASYSNLIAAFRNVSLDSDVAGGGRQWTYQTCAEFAYFQTSDSSNQVFGDLVPLSFFTQQCKDIYGIDTAAITQNVKDTNMFYGGRANNASGIFFVNGEIDPWHALSILSPVVPTSPTFVMTDTAHCAAMYPPAATDAADLVKARQLVTETIREWLM